MTLFTEPYPYTNSAALFAALAHMPYSLLLDSSDLTHPDSRYSYILTNPIETIEAKGLETTIISHEKLKTIRNKNPFDILKTRLAAHDIDTPTNPDLPPFQGGAAGLFGYDLGRTLETIPDLAIDNPDLPDMAIGIYDQILAFDHELKKAWIITHAKNQLEAQMKQAVLMNNLAAKRANQHMIASAPLQWQAQFKPAEFKARITKTINYIRQGDIFQANLAQKFEATLPRFFCPYAHYQHLRTVNPAPFAGFMNCGETAIACSSPERFISADHQGHVTTKPIKGTIARGKTPAKDAAQKAKLNQSAKDKAENIMITDLLRNDLSKCCQPSSVEVLKLCALETFAGLHHLVTTITGKLRENLTAIDLLKASFPGGSITGAPKIRAMEIIEELEPARRGPYCGSLGYIGFNGAMDTNILIRSLVYEDNRVSLHVGSGITALSEPDAEHEETLIKAQAIFDSFNDEDLNAVG